MTVKDWSDAENILQDNPHVEFRWFPRIRPRGLYPLGEVAPRTEFAAYLRSARLRYYALQDHLATHPPPDETIETEGHLLDRLEQNEIVALIATGEGGFGKTRLTYELGALAEGRDWFVFELRGSVDLDDVFRLQRSVRQCDPMLLVIDYAETFPNFRQLLELAIEINRDRGWRLHVVASCRNSYWPSLRAIPLVGQVNLSPSPPNIAAWFRTYRRETVRHILDR